MESNPGLSVRMFLNVARAHLDDTSDAELLRRFAESFCSQHWPGRRCPQVFYDPRSLVLGGGPKASLHAKCIVVDDERAFVTSANLTEAAQERNIEAGVLIRDPVFGVLPASVLDFSRQEPELHFLQTNRQGTGLSRIRYRIFSE